MKQKKHANLSRICLVTTLIFILTAGAFYFPRPGFTMVHFTKEEEEDRKKKEKPLPPVSHQSDETTNIETSNDDGVKDKPVFKKKEVYEYEKTPENGIIIRKKTITTEE